MTVTASTSDEMDNVVLITVEEEWGWAELHDALTEPYVLEMETGQPVSIILDFETTKAPHGSIAHLVEVQRDSYFEDELAEGAVLVGAEGMVKAVAETLRAVFPHTQEKIDFAETMGEAYALIETRRS